MTPAATRRLVDAVRALTPAERRKRSLALLQAPPPLIDLEVSSACNVVCTFCPRSQMTRGQGRMSEETFTAVEAFLPRDAVIMISGLGDALLHPALPAWVTRLTVRGHATCLITNGVLLTPERQQALIAAGIAQLQVSVHGLDMETVSRVMPRGARPTQVRAHLDHLARTRPAHVRVRLNFVETDANGHARAEVEAYARQRGFDFFYRREHTRGGALGRGRPARADEGCGIFATVTFISKDGDVLPCVNDVRGDGRLGNVRTFAWADVVSWKRRIIGDDRWFDACAGCDDDYRWIIIGQGGLDEAPEQERER